ncbi:MAG: hypothetical protein NVSMB23_16070 [Myxococcales bacterium]
MILVAVVAAALAGGPCALPAPAAVPDRDAALGYLEVGDAELAGGAPATATVAYREAVRLDPSNPRARAAYRLACEQAGPANSLAWARQQMDAGNCDAAIGQFERLRALGKNPLATLLEGVCRYEQTNDDAARPLLLEAAREPGLAGRANYFLGLIDLRDGAGAAAAARFEQVANAREGSLSERARLLRGTALRTGRGVLSVFAESGYDSNVSYAPDGVPASPDGAGTAGLSLALRPTGLAGPYLRASGSYRTQLQFHDQDAGVAAAQVGWRAGRGETYAFGDYGFEATILGGAPYLYAHRLRGGARWQARRVALSAVYAARFASYQTPSSAGYSGLYQILDPDISLRFPLGSSLSLGYHAGRDAADLPETRSWDHGPRATARLVLLPSLRANLEAGFAWRRFDAAAAGAGQARSDRILFAGAALEKDFADRFTLRLAAGDRRAWSNLPGLSYSRVTATLGLSYTLGLF